MTIPREAPTPRKSVQRFAAEMERRLARHDRDRGRRGWKNDDPWALIKRIRDELGELEAAYAGDAETVGEWVQRMTTEAADVANFAMMVADAAQFQARQEKQEAR